MRRFLFSGATWLWLVALGLPAASANAAQPGPPDPRLEDDEEGDDEPGDRPAAGREVRPAAENRDRGGRDEGDKPGARRDPNGPPPPPLPPRRERRERGDDNGPPDRAGAPGREAGRDAAGPPPRRGARPGGMMGGPGMRGMMGGMAPGMRAPADRLEQLREVDPEMAKLEEADIELDRRTHELADQVRRTPPGEAREKLKQELTEVVSKHFEVRQERRELEIKRLEAQLERLRTLLKKRTDDRQAIIDQRLSTLLGDDELGF